MEMDEFGAVGRFGKSLSGAAGLTVVVEFESGGEGGRSRWVPLRRGRPNSGDSSRARATRPTLWWRMGADGLPSASDSATWRASTARAAEPCTLPERSEAHTESAGMPSACPRQLFRGCLASSPNPCAPRGGAPWNLGKGDSGNMEDTETHAPGGINRSQPDA